MKQLSHASCVVYVTKLWHRQTRLHNPCNCLCQDVILGGCWRDPRSPILLISLHTKVTLPALLSTPKLLHIVHAFPRLGYHAELKFDSLLWYALSSSSSFNVMRTQSPTDHTLFTALRQCWTVPRCQTTSGYTVVLFTSIGQMPLLVPTLDNIDSLSALLIVPGFYLHHLEVHIGVKVVDQDPASCSLWFLLPLLHFPSTSTFFVWHHL